MENARVIVIEDRERDREEACGALLQNGHMVTGEAATYDEAIAMVDAVHVGDIEADVFVLDGNLTRGQNNCFEARMIAKKIKDLGLTQKIIGNSLLPLRQYKVPVDADARKDVRSLIDAIAEL